MKHDIRLNAHGIGLRPVLETDAAFIVELRNSPHAAGRIGDSTKTVDAQLAWLRRQADAPNDYLFIIEQTHNQSPCGMLGIYGIEGKTGEWGRWVVKPDVPAAAASALLVLRICFERLRLETVRALIVSSNREVIAFHERIGYTYVGVAASPRVIGGESIAMQEYQVQARDWPSMCATLERYAAAAHSWIQRSASGR